MPGPPPCHLDARPLAGQRTGIGVFTAQIVQEWPGPLVHHVRSGGPAHDPAAGGPPPVGSGPVGSTGPGPTGPGPAGPQVRAHRGGPAWHLQTAWAVRRAHAAYLSTDSMIVPILLGRRATLVIHDLAPLLHPGAHHRRARLFFRLLLGTACRRVGAIVVPSAATRADLQRRHPGVAGRVRVAPEAPRTLPPPEPLPAHVRRPFILHTGTHEPRKNVVALVAGFLGSAVSPSWQLVLAGRPGWLSPGDAARLDALVAAAPERVVRLGYVTDGVLAGLYDAADLFVYPSSYEGFGLPVIEAMHRGVPVVTTTAAALAELAGDAAVVVELGPGLADRLGSALAGLAADADARATLAARGRDRAAGFGWARTAAVLADAVAGAPAAARRP